MPPSSLFGALRSSHLEAEQSRIPQVIEAALAHAKSLRIDPDVISSAEGVLERPHLVRQGNTVTCAVATIHEDAWSLRGNWAYNDSGSSTTRSFKREVDKRCPYLFKNAFGVRICS